jgi:Protein of unknown function (DUF1552)
MTGVSRRTLLRGLGVAVALPPLQARAGTAAPPLRMAFIGVPNGVHQSAWRPTGVGRDFTLGPTFAPVLPFKRQLQLYTGLRQRNADALGDGGGDHARANAAFLTGAHPRKTAGADIRNGISVDQVAAQAIGHLTRLPSLELICVRVRRSGSCDSGYSCAYEYNLSWASETLPMAAESNPRQVFERLFGDGRPRDRQRLYLERQRRRRSLLDFVRQDAQQLQGQLGGDDRRKIEEYLGGIREIERQIERAEQHRLPVTRRPVPDGPPEDFGAHIRLMSDLLALAFQSDSTRIATLLFANEGNNRSFSEIGIAEGHHHLSHHQGKADNLEKVARIDRFYMEQFAYFLGKLAAARDAGGGSVLDSSLVLYGGAIGDGDRHNHDDLPIVLAGGGGRPSTVGRHVKLDRVPLNNLLLGMLGRMGVARDRLGDSTGVFEDI